MAEKQPTSESADKKDGEAAKMTDVQREELDKEVRRRLDVLRSKVKRMVTSETNFEWDEILRLKDYQILIFSSIGLFFSIFLSYYKWDSRCVQDELGNCSPLPSSTGLGRVTATLNNTSLYLNNTWWIMLIAQALLSFSTLITCWLIVQYYQLLLQDRRRESSGMKEMDLLQASAGEAKRRRHLFNSSYSFMESSLRWKMLAEVLVHAIHPLLFVEIQGPLAQTIYEITEIFVFFRVYIIVRVVYVNSDAYVLRDSIISRCAELRSANYRITVSSTFKTMFYNHPAAVMGTVTLSVIIVFGFWIFVIERNGNPQFAVLWDCYWFVWVTVATIGYGDITATSITGRYIVIVMAITSLLIMTIFNGIVTNLLAPTREQKYVEGFLEQRAARKEYREAAGNLLYIVVTEKRRMVDTSTMSSRSSIVYDAMKRFRKARLALRQSFGSAADPVLDNKLQRIMAAAQSLTLTLHQQGERLLELQDRVTRSNQYIRALVGTGGRKRDIPLPFSL